MLSDFYCFWQEVKHYLYCFYPSFIQIYFCPFHFPSFLNFNYYMWNRLFHMIPHRSPSFCLFFLIFFSSLLHGFLISIDLSISSLTFFFHVESSDGLISKLFISVWYFSTLEFPLDFFFYRVCFLVESRSRHFLYKFTNWLKNHRKWILEESNKFEKSKRNIFYISKTYCITNWY